MIKDTLIDMSKEGKLKILSRLTRIEKAVKNTTIFVIYKVLVYIQMYCILQISLCF